MATLLKVENLNTIFRTERGIVHAVNGVTYDINEGEIVGLVGESGCGKSVSQLSVMQLIPNPPGEIVDGSVIFEGNDLLKYSANGPEMRAIRGAKISMIFQEPMTSLNPALRISTQMAEVLQLHLKMGKQEAVERSIEQLRLVGIPDPARRIEDYPHQFSGGMRQRVMVAMAMLCDPKLIIADEATTALDATIQAQMLELMHKLVVENNTAMVLVTHNLGVVARYANRINIMYAGKIVESGTVKEVWSNPRHPYTIGLLNCVPKLGKKLIPIYGMPPNLLEVPEICAFQPRCRYQKDVCRTGGACCLKHIEGQHYAACHVEIGVNSCESNAK